MADHDAETLMDMPNPFTRKRELSVSLPLVGAVVDTDPHGQVLRARVASTPPPPAADRPVPKLGSYALMALFRSSPYAQVFLAHKESTFGTLHTAVVKWVSKDHQEYAVCREMLIDEGRAMAMIDHANVVKVLDLEELQRGVYLAMEYVSGPDLRTILDLLARRDARLPYALSAFLVAAILRGLHAAHFTNDFNGTEAQIIHRDVNPSNILVSSSGEAKLADFGVVRMRSRAQAMTMPGIVKGKLRYMSPEYMRGEVCTLQTDVYSMGVTLYELLSGVMPLADLEATQAVRIAMEVGLSVKPLTKMGVPEPLVKVVQRAIARLPADRFTSAGEMADAIVAWLDEQPVHVDAHTLGAYMKDQNMSRGQVRGMKRWL